MIARREGVGLDAQRPLDVCFCPAQKQTFLTRDNRHCSVSINAYARRIDVSLGSKNRLARSDPTKKTKPSAISTVPAQAAVDPPLSALAAAGTSGVVGGAEEAAMSLSGVDAAKSISTLTERGAARSGVSGSIVGWAAMAASRTGITGSRVGTEAVSTGSDASGGAALST
jgi:hypothetical protein